MSVKMKVENLFSSLIRVTGTCSCRVSAVGVKVITIQYFDKFHYAFWGLYQFNFSHWWSTVCRV